MKLRPVTQFVAALLVVAPALAQPATPAPAPGPATLTLGAKAPLADRAMTGVDGTPVTLATAAGPKGLLVVFTCNACPYAIAWEERIVALGNEYAKQGIGVVAVNSNDPAIVPGDGLDEMKKRAAERTMQFPYVVDQGAAVARAFGATRTPEAFLFDAQGALVYHGTIDDNHKAADQVTKRYLEDALAAVAAGKPVTVAETKAIGCGIKFPKT
jgi:peroxiredoxin